MLTKKEQYDRANKFLKKKSKINLKGWPKNTHEAAIKFSKIKKDDLLLEVGCGRGEHFKYFLKKTKKVYGIDISELILKEIPFKEVSLFLADIEKKTPFKEEFFDIVISVDVIEHVTNRYYALREMKRILKRGGKLIIITPNLVKARNRFRFLFGKYPHTGGKKIKKGVDFFDGGHLQYFTFETLRELGKKEGLKVIKEFGFGRFGKIHNLFKSFMSGSICIVFEKI